MITVAIVAAASALGLAIAVIGVLQAGIAREEADHSLLGDPATRAASVTRRMVGLYVRTPDQLADPGHCDYQHATRSGQRPPGRPGR
jgi:hypothetical protein